MTTDISRFVEYYYTDTTCSTCEDKVQKIYPNQYLFNYPCESTTECVPFRVRLKPGKYVFELWGAQGGNSRELNVETIRQNSGGKGSYVRGTITFTNFITLYFYIGGKGEDQKGIEKNAYGKGGFNGGGNGGYDPIDDDHPESAAGGGGATDIRLIPHSDGEMDSLKSRIAVASGGGGAVTSGSNECEQNIILENTFLCSNINVIRDFHGGPAGILHGYSYNDFTFPPNQTNGIFGKGSHGSTIHHLNGGSVGGAGGGYYGGTCVTEEDLNEDQYIECGGAGGSSYMSGYEGCNSVKENPKDEIVHSNSKYHYSRNIFTKITMKSGLQSFKNQNGEDENGHSGSGAIKLTFLAPYDYITYKNKLIQPSILSFTFIMINTKQENY